MEHVALECLYEQLRHGQLFTFRKIGRLSFPSSSIGCGNLPTPFTTSSLEYVIILSTPINQASCDPQSVGTCAGGAGAQCTGVANGPAATCTGTTNSAGAPCAWTATNLCTYTKRKPKRVCNECIETFIERIEPDNLDIDAVSRLEEHLLLWEERRLVTHAQHHVDKLHTETESLYTKYCYRVRKCLCKLRLIKGQLARQTRQAIATSSSQIEDQRIRHQLEDDLNVAQGD